MEENEMVDTMTIYREFKNYGEYSEAKDTLDNYIKGFNKNQSLHWNGNKYITYAFASYGIEELYFKQNIKCRIYIKFRPKLMVERGNYNEVLRAYDIPDLYIRFREQMNKTELTSLSDLSIWKVKRIDYAVDIIVSQKDIPMYIQLFKKGNIPEILLKNEKTIEYWNADNNLYLSGTSYRINFYDRHRTVRMKQDKKDKHFYNVNDLYGVFRFEVQLRDIDITGLKKSGLVHKNCVRDFLNPDLCKYFVLRNYNMLIGKGNYYSYHDALSKCKSGTQYYMIKLIHDEGSIYQAKRKFLASSDNKRKAEKKFSEIINKLQSDGINPVTIESGVIKNLYSKILYQIEGSNQYLIRRRKKAYEE